MGAMLSCATDKSTCNTPFGSLSIGHCACFGSSKKEKTPERERIAAELTIVEQLLLSRMRGGILNVYIETKQDQIILHLERQSNAVPPETVPTVDQSVEARRVSIDADAEELPPVAPRLRRSVAYSEGLADLTPQ